MDCDASIVKICSEVHTRRACLASAALISARYITVGGQLTDTARIRTIRKDIARILTIQHERRMDAAVRAELERSGSASQ